MNLGVEMSVFTANLALGLKHMRPLAEAEVNLGSFYTARTRKTGFIESFRQINSYPILTVIGNLTDNEGSNM